MQKRLLSILALATIGVATAIAPTDAQAGYTISFMPKFVGHPVFTQANEELRKLARRLAIR
jgi:ABC-type sugar transport system substrate-binding protein